MNPAQFMYTLLWLLMQSKGAHYTVASGKTHALLPQGQGFDSCLRINFSSKKKEFVIYLKRLSECPLVPAILSRKRNILCPGVSAIGRIRQKIEEIPPRLRSCLPGIPYQYRTTRRSPYQ
uniref:Secreted protein n=1 Tax=Cacopsylla melanoneura TaxID=428564 RepID=A0A8D8Z6R5_9HEMI